MATRTGSSGNNTLNGTNGDDTILGLGGMDTLNGNGGNDVIVAGPGGSDTIDGGSGTDTLVLNGNFADYTVSFNNGNVLFTRGATVETLRNVELVGFDDKLVRIVGAGSETASIQSAVNAADPSDPDQPGVADSILVAPGDYSGEGRILIADKNIEILGATFGSRPSDEVSATIIDGIDLTGSTSLTLDGVILTGETQPSGNGISGILAANSGSVTVLHSQISASQAPDTNGVGIDVSSGTGDVTVDDVAFTGFTGTSDVSSFGVFLNFDANTVRDVSITDSDFDLRADGGDADLRSYGVALDGYGAGAGSLDVSGNTFSNSTWGLLIWDSQHAVTVEPDYSGIAGNTFTDTNEAVGNIRNLTDFVITTGSNISNGVTYDRFLVGTGDAAYAATTGGNDTLTGNGGNELIAGNDGDDQITGAGGNDKIYGGTGNDTANVNVASDGADQVDLGTGLDTVNASGASQIRVTFTSAEVGNGNVNDGGTGANQDGGLAVRLQGEDGTGVVTGDVGRYDDEGITFVAANGTKFDVRDLVLGTQRGDQFDAVSLGTSGNDTSALTGAINYYANGGSGNDTITTGAGNDFLVGGTGNDTLTGGAGNDSYIGGSGTDTIVLNGALDGYSVSFVGTSVLFTLDADSTVKNVTSAEFVSFDDKRLRIVGAGSETTTIQAAVNAADANSATPDSILVAPGDYSAEGRILISDKNIEILGANFGSATSSAPATIIDGIDLVGSTSLTLDGVTLTGQTRPSGNGVSGILAANSGDVTVRNSQISTSQGSSGANGVGIDVSSGTGDVTVDNVDFTGFTGLSSVSSYGVYLNYSAATNRDVSITDSDFDLRAGGSSDLRSYGIVFDGYGVGTCSLAVTGNTFNNTTWGMLFFDSADGLTAAPDYSGIAGNTFTNTNEAVGNIRNGTDFIITTGSNISNGVLYERFLVGTGDTLSSASGDDVLLGDSGNELIAGNAGNDQITGAGGNDKIYGGAGNDTANVNVATDGADQVDLGTGLDIVNVSGAAQVRVTFTSAEVGNANVNDGVTGTNQDGGLAVRLQGENGSDGLTGDVGRYDDEGITFVAASGTTFDVRDLVSGAQRGDQFNAVFLGTSGNDSTTFAGALNYYVNGGAGNDALTTTGSGNSFLVGGTGNDTLTGGSGNDSFLGGSGIDTIVGGLGNDVLDGGADADSLAGGAGDDSYVVDNSGDVVTEAANAGTDTVTVQTLTGYTLGVNVENLVYNGTADFNAKGNTLNNTITTGSGNDILAGSAGADTMIGGAGNDAYIIQGADTVVEAANGGTDEVRSSVQSLSLLSYNNIENARLTGTSNLNVTGNQGDNVLSGNDGMNIITGGMGRDTMTGGAGADVFKFNAVNETGNTTSLADIIRDFTQGSDLIDLFAIDARPGTGAANAGNNAFNFIGNDAFTAGAAGQLRFEQTGGNTYVQGNVSGSGTADFTIRLNGAVNLNDGDFVL